MNSSKSLQKLSVLALFTAVGLVLAWVERLIPMSAVIPGLKLGLANAAVIIVLDRCGVRSALTVSAARILLVNLLFGSLSGLLYAACGALLSLAGMAILKRTKRFGTVGISAAGGVLHNLGQIGAACLLVNSSAPLAYLPPLCLGGAVCGTAVGVLAAVIIRRIGSMFDKVFPQTDTNA